MFVPRQVQKPHRPQKHHTAGTGHSTSLPRSSSGRKKATLLQVAESSPQKRSKSNTTTPNAAPTKEAPKDKVTAAAAGVGTVDPLVAKAIVLALEQLFGCENPHTRWLEGKSRSVDGHDDYIHMSAVIECPYLQEHKPQLSQILLRRALEVSPSKTLETSPDAYHLRLANATKRATLQDINTVYIEPSITGLTRVPGKLALELQKTLPSKLLPVQFTHTDSKSWALVTLSSKVTEEHLEDKSIWPQSWIVLSTAEWKSRDYLYRQRRKEALEQRQNAEHIPALATREDSGPSPSAKKYEPGLIVHVTNLHEKVNKPTISSFAMRSVDRYVRKREKKVPGEAAEPHKLQINYIDYAKGTCEAYLRQPTANDSELIVKALRKRRRVMRDGEDGKGKKASRQSKDEAVAGRLLEGEEEKLYWERIEKTMKETKKRSSKKTERNAEKERDKERRRKKKRSEVDSKTPPRTRTKRPRLSSGAGNGGERKKKRYDDDEY